MKNISKLLISAGVLSAMYGCTISNEYDPDVFEAYENSVQAEKQKEQAKNDATCESSFKDTRDGYIYNLVRIYDATLDNGKAHCWFDANLAYEAPKSKCHEDSEDCEKYGRLYQGSQLTEVCPEGSHIATLADWNHLVKAKNIAKDGSKVLKATEDDDWEGDADAATDAFGFAALAGGAFDATDGYYSVGESGYWWLVAGDSLYSVSIHRDENTVGAASYESSFKNRYYSVRCVVGKGDSPSSSGDGDQPSKEEIKDNTKISITGYAQKGPYVKGTEVSAYALNNESELKQVGDPYTGTVIDDNGKFSIENIDLVSKVALITVSGQFRSELTGKPTADYVNLRAITDLSKREKVNINVLTNMEYDRVFYLVTENNKSLAQAKKKADSEIFKAFFIDIADSIIAEDLDINNANATDADVALIAMSIMVLGGNNAGETVDMMKAIGADLAKDGTLDNDSIKARIADWLAENDIKDQFEGIAQNVAQMTSSEKVKNFKKYLTTFWLSVYGMEPCSDTNNGKVAWTDNTHSKYAKESLTRFICKDKQWKFATDVEKDTENWVNAKDGDAKHGLVNVDVVYVFDGDIWRVGNEFDISLNLGGCTKKRNRDVGKGADDSWYICDATVPSWIKTSTLKSEFSKYTPDDINAAFESDDVFFGTMTDKRDNQVYKTVKIGTQTWMAQNLNYVSKGGNADDGKQSWCYDNLDYNCKLFGRLYSWTAAHNIDQKNLLRDVPYTINDDGRQMVECNGTSQKCKSYLFDDSKNRIPMLDNEGLPMFDDDGNQMYKFEEIDSDAVIKSRRDDTQGICPDGWRLPTSEDVLALLDNIDNDVLLIKTRNFWEKEGTNSSGFTVIPSGRRNDAGKFENTENLFNFWITSSDDATTGEGYITNDADYDEEMWGPELYKKSAGMSIRCIKK